ncbi:MAG: aminotransferase class I/II-fold pyridoxal phosphate-dependent enzyme, partial [Patescibacteria group bacterium]
MSIFNSLGSNYNLNFALKALSPEVARIIHLQGGISSKLKKYLEKKYGGEAVLLFKGREALTLAIKNLNLPEGSGVAINGFTCYAVYKAIEEAGLKPVLVDLPGDNLNFTRSDLVKALENNPKIKVVIIQNTLGYPCDIEEIAKICKEKKLILIEDLAHSVGTKYKNGKEAGTVGDMIIFSFSQDKIIDGVSGGALIIHKPRRSQAYDLRGWENKNPPLSRQLKDRLYPLLTWKIRTTYDLGFGKLFHYNLKKINLLSLPMDESLYGFLNLPNFYQKLIQDSFLNLKSNLSHRKKIAEIYKENLPERIMFDKINSQIDNSSNLRFPIFVKDRDNLIKYLKTKNFHLS